MTKQELKNFLLENYYHQIKFAKENSCYSMKDLNKKGFKNAKEHYKLFPRNENTKSVKQSKIINIKRPKLPKSSHKLTKTIKQAENVS